MLISTEERNYILYIKPLLLQQIQHLCSPHERKWKGFLAYLSKKNASRVNAGCKMRLTPAALKPCI